LNLNALTQAQAEFTDAIMASLRSVPFRDLHEPLYHFTDRAGLEGILQTRSLWASLAMALEGAAEITYALSLAKQILARNEWRRDRPFFDEIIPLLDPLQSRTIDALGMKTYVVSFRTRVDQSAHWETYGRSGTGFALGFGIKQLLIPGILALPILYDSEGQERLLREFMTGGAALFHRLSQACAAEHRDVLRLRAIHWTALGVWTLAPAMKDSARFAHEGEWRLIVTDLEHVPMQCRNGLSKEVRIRNANGRAIPYKLLQYEALPITDIVLGPHAAIEDNDLGLVELLRYATAGRSVPITRAPASVGSVDSA
jgi:hypothetical protein